MKEEIIYNLLILESKAQLSATEQVELDRCRISNPEDVSSVEKLLHLSSDLVYMSDQDINESWHNIERILKSDQDQPAASVAKPHRRRLSRSLLAFAAALFFLAAAYFIWTPGGESTYATQDNRIEQTLQDGSKLIINKASKSVANMSFGQSARELNISGEVYIEAVSSAVPMKVFSDQFEIEVIGTRFNVMDFAEDDIATVTLYEGAIDLTLPNGDHLSMVPGDHVCYDKAKRRVNRSTTSAAGPAWQDGKLVFEDLLFSEVFTRLERTFDVEISGQELLDGLHFNDEVGDGNLEMLLSRVATATGYDIQKSGPKSYQITQKK